MLNTLSFIQACPTHGYQHPTMQDCFLFCFFLYTIIWCLGLLQPLMSSTLAETLNLGLYLHSTFYLWASVNVVNFKMFCQDDIYK